MALSQSKLFWAEYIFAKLASEPLQYLLKPENLQLPADTLAYHIDLGNLTVAAVKTLSLQAKVPPFSGQSTRISQDNNKLEVNDPTIIVSGISANSSVIHAIVQALFPSKY